MQILRLIVQNKTSFDLQILANQRMPTIVVLASIHVVYHVRCLGHHGLITGLEHISGQNDVTICNVGSDWLLHQVA